MIERVERELPPGAWPTWVLSNHDVRRVRTRLGSEAAARAAAVILTTQRGTPFVYQGDELGLEDAVVPERPPRRPRRSRRMPGARCRGSPTACHGWPAAPWLPWPPQADARNASVAAREPASMLHLYRDLLAARRASPALRRGTVRLLDAPGDVLAYERVSGEDRRLVLVNFGEQPARRAARRAVAGGGGQRSAADAGSLPPHGAALLRPAR